MCRSGPDDLQPGIVAGRSDIDRSARSVAGIDSRNIWRAAMAIGAYEQEVADGNEAVGLRLDQYLAAGAVSGSDSGNIASTAIAVGRNVDTAVDEHLAAVLGQDPCRSGRNGFA